MADVTTTITTSSLDDVLDQIDTDLKDKTPSLLGGLDDVNPIFDQPNEKDKDKVVDDKDADKDKDKDKDTDKDKGAKDKDKSTSSKDKDKLEDVIDADKDKDLDDDEDKDKAKPTSSLLTAITKLVEKGEMFLFDDDKKLEDYTETDLVDLIASNKEHARQEVLDKEIPEFFQSLPQEIQYAAKYVADGGKDMKALFKALAATEEIKELDIKTPKGQENTLREYYRAMDWGSDEEIDEEVERVKELGAKELEKQAAKFQPKLQKMHEEVVQGQLLRQQQIREQQDKELHQYVTNAHASIKPAKLGDIKLDQKTQAQLYNGLTQMSYQTRKGNPTNELGALLDKYQFVEPNFDKIYKALWLLRDEEGFFKAFGRKVENDANTQTARILKTGQGKGNSSQGDDTDKVDNKTTKRIARPGKAPGFMSGLTV